MSKGHRVDVVYFIRKYDQPFEIGSFCFVLFCLHEGKKFGWINVAMNEPSALWLKGTEILFSP